MIHISDVQPENDEDVDRGYAFWVKHGIFDFDPNGIAHYTVAVGEKGEEKLIAIPNPATNYDLFKLVITRLYHGYYQENTK